MMGFDHHQYQSSCKNTRNGVSHSPIIIRTELSRSRSRSPVRFEEELYRVRRHNVQVEYSRSRSHTQRIIIEDDMGDMERRSRPARPSSPVALSDRPMSRTPSPKSEQSKASWVTWKPPTALRSGASNLPGPSHFVGVNSKKNGPAPMFSSNRQQRFEQPIVAGHRRSRSLSAKPVQNADERAASEWSAGREYLERHRTRSNSPAAGRWEEGLQIEVQPKPVPQKARTQGLQSLIPSLFGRRSRREALDKEDKKHNATDMTGYGDINEQPTEVVRRPNIGVWRDTVPSGAYRTPLSEPATEDGIDGGGTETSSRSEVHPQIPGPHLHLSLSSRHFLKCLRRAHRR
ncbi:hypothetical protein SCHPADRAFT_278145 [Schizopora paradoxa]|uniref:Uncharacterized protein n=1 Tax=Schizopora paradoxa TaxID=27342 RepID=A0A0H2RTN2_9AGAM|nr:hypothetical protein SCHPADRAFT_278145 [Schizopora paradoxa]